MNLTWKGMIRLHPYHHPLFCKFIVYFNCNQDYFECHEVLEEYWKSITPCTKEHPLTGFIQLSTSLYHWRRANFSGAYRTMVKAEQKLSRLSQYDNRYTEEIDVNHLLDHIHSSLKKIENAGTFSPFVIKVTSSNLSTLLQTTADGMQLLPMNSDAVIHKHMLRDRSDILAEREKKKGRPR